MKRRLWFTILQRWHDAGVTREQAELIVSDIGATRGFRYNWLEERVYSYIPEIWGKEVA